MVQQESIIGDVSAEAPPSVAPVGASVGIGFTQQAMADLANPSLLARAVSAGDVLSPLRYPGGKRRLAPFIAGVLSESGRRPVLTVEPFAGGASVSLYLLQRGLTETIGIADIDPFVASFWKTVFYDTEWLIAEIESIPITLEKWEEFKAGNPQSTRDQAIACLFLNRTSFSGIIARSSGPLGGKAQQSRYKLGCRFPRESLQRRVRDLSQMRKRVAFVHQWAWTDSFAFIREEAK